MHIYRQFIIGLARASSSVGRQTSSGLVSLLSHRVNTTVGSIPSSIMQSFQMHFIGDGANRETMSDLA